MIKDGRVASIVDDGKIVAVVFFSLCNDETQHLWNYDYNYHYHDPKGKILVFEGFVCKNFNFRIVKKMKEMFYAKFPQIEKTIWRRDNRSKDRVFTLHRRQHEVQH